MPLSFFVSLDPRKNKFLCIGHSFLPPSMAKPINPLKVLPGEGCTAGVHEGQKDKVKTEAAESIDTLYFCPQDDASWVLCASVATIIFLLIYFQD